MKIIIAFIFFVGILVSPHTSGGTDYTGIWKGDCSDYYGIQIKPAGNQLYSVSFCGLDGCFEPGKWTPNTRIEGDPKYKVISPTQIGIKRTDGGGYFTYQKCTSDPTWIVAQPQSTEARKIPDCSLATASKEEGVIIAWVTDVREFTQFGRGIETQTIRVGPIRPIALLKDTGLKETLGATIYKGQSFWRVLSPVPSPLKLTSVGSFFDHLVDRCVYYGTLDKPNLPRWTLLSSKPLPGVFRAPSANDRTEFYRLNTSCVIQGDYLEGKAPPCTRPKLLAVSDINKNRKPQYWATQPYVWDTGVTVWESNSGQLVKLLEVCVGCAD
jgi:hypothetical protein